MTRLPRILLGALASITFAASLTPPRAGAATVPRTPGAPRYVTELSTGAHGHVWRGMHEVTFTNLESAPLRVVYLRLWSNGVQGCGAPSAITVSDLTGGTVETLAKDCTLARVGLDAPLPQGRRTTLAMGLRIEVPAINDRFGHHEGLALMGTALPTLAVRDDLGWHRPPFIDLGESFYSVAGRYRVTLRTPVALDTPATGVLVARTPAGPGHERRTYAATDVRDFAWAAGRLRRIERRAGATRVVVSYAPGLTSSARARAALRHAIASMDAFSDAFGRYPYKEVEVVSTRFVSFSGMEYPTIVFSNPDRLTIAHELAHQWWYGIVGNDEFTEPWLDESFATWSQYLPFDPWRSCPGFVFRGPGRMTEDMAYWAANPAEYGTVYGGGGCMLAQLSHEFGLRRFTSVLRGHAGAHWLGVARTADFVARIERAASRHAPGFDVAGFWSAWRVD